MKDSSSDKGWLASDKGWLATPSRILRPDGIRIVFLLVAVGAFLMTEFGRHVYRPWAYGQGLSDFGIADSVGNLGGIVVQIFVTVAFFNATRAQSFRLAVFLSCGYIVYEFVQPYLPRGTFDWKDVAATLLGGCLSCILLWIIWCVDGLRTADTGD
jgi:hypothetical protein